jgi:hypothetical protein
MERFNTPVFTSICFDGLGMALGIDNIFQLSFAMIFSVRQSAHLLHANERFVKKRNIVKALVKYSV